MDDQSLFGRWLQRRRRALDLTQRELAARVRCSAATIRKLEADDRRPSKRIAAALGRSLGVEESELEPFMRFARGGWADVPPPHPDPALDRPWRGTAGAAGPPAAGAPAAGPPAAGAPAPTSAPPASTDARAGAPPRSAAGTAASLRRAMTVDDRFVARDAELGRLSAELASALAGETRVVMVAGEAGQGKSALLRGFVSSAVQRHPGLLVAGGTCNAYVGAGDPFLPFRQVLAQLVGDAPVGAGAKLSDAARADRLRRRAGSARAILERIAPHALDALVDGRREAGAPPGSPDTLAASGFGVPEAALRAEVSAGLAAVADACPLLLVLDDLQWVDRSSAELLLHVALSAGSVPLMVLGAFRASEVAAGENDRRHVLDVVLRELERRSGRVVLDLAAADARAFLDAYLDSEPNVFDEGFRGALWRQTGGQPLLTVELLHDLRERGDVVRAKDGRWSASPSLQWTSVPDRVAGALAQRLARVPGPAREILRVASVEGTEFTTEVTADVLGLDAAAVARAVGDLVVRHRLVAHGELRRIGDATVARHHFRHDLIHRFVYERLEDAERARLHGAVADALERLYVGAVDPGVMAHHLLRAKAPERASPYLRAAGDRARRAAALEEAIDHYRAAAAHAADPEPRWRAELLASLGECLWLRSRYAPALEALGEAQALFHELGDALRAAAVQLTVARVWYEQGRRDAAMGGFERAVAALEAGPESPVLARAVSCVAQLHMLSSDFATAVTWGERALAIAERVGAHDVTVHALNNVGCALANGSGERRADGLAMLQRSYDRSLDLGLVYDGCRAAYNLANLEAAYGEFDRARGTFRALIALASRHQIFAMEQAGILARSLLEWRVGAWAWVFEQRPKLDAIITGMEPDSVKPTTASVFVAGFELDLGRPAVASAYLARFADALERQVEPQWRVPYLRARLGLAAALGHADEADGRGLELVALATSGLVMFDGLADALRDTARWWLRGLPRGPRGPECEASLRTAIGLLPQAGPYLGQAPGAATTAESCAFAAQLRGEEAAAAERFEGAAAAWHDAGLSLDELRAWQDAARAFAAAALPSRARTARQRAAAIVDALASVIPDAGVAAGFREWHANPDARTPPRGVRASAGPS